MRPHRLLAIAVLVIAASAALLPDAPAGATGGADADHRTGTLARAGAYSFAVIGDVPYGDAQLARFPGWIRQINADPAVESVVHVGDIKNDSTLCSDAYFSLIRGDLDGFEDPLVYTPGDNEWTDCHRRSNGAFNPLERLRAVRATFFDHPGQTLGRAPMAVHSQAARGYPENVRYRRAHVTFVAAHVPGSDNALRPWTGLGRTVATSGQRAEVADRTRADIALLRAAFARAKDLRDRGVVVMQQADMFDPASTPTQEAIGAYRPWVQALVDEASHFRGPVYLVNGDSHVYHRDRPLASGSPWLSTYAVQGVADHLVRVTVDGAANNTDYLRVRVAPPGGRPLLTWRRVAYTS